MRKKRRSAKLAEPMRGIAVRYEAGCTAAMALTMASCTCLSVLAMVGVDVKASAGAIVAILLAVSKLCTSLGYR